jgi:L-ascorbate metabolism protein UlaG (beta-lactamase superfamily)
MKQKPFIRNGRYYNDAHDSILFRLKNVVRMIWRAGKQAAKGQRSKSFVMQPNSLADWHVKPILQQHSHQPIITWLGHATFLIQIDGFNILTDPVFYDISVFAQRLMPTPLQPSQLAPIDAILISHNHKDHVDEKSLKDLKHHQPLMAVPMGTEAWFRARGFNNVEEKMWHENLSLQKNGKTLTLTFLPSSHWTGRSLLDINKSLWGSWMIESQNFKIYFAGDTAYSDHFAQIGKTFGPIDVALMPIGPNEPRDLMYDAHVSAQEALQGFIELNARHFIPMHWGTFVFGLDSFILPIERITKAWAQQKMDTAGAQLHLLKMGQSVQLSAGQPAVVQAQTEDFMHPSQT